MPAGLTVLDLDATPTEVASLGGERPVFLALLRHFG
jgi:hypothetical protein